MSSSENLGEQYREGMAELFTRKFVTVGEKPHRSNLELSEDEFTFVIFIFVKEHEGKG